jgi:hypothetical protein
VIDNDFEDCNASEWLEELTKTFQNKLNFKLIGSKIFETTSGIIQNPTPNFLMTLIEQLESHKFPSDIKCFVLLVNSHGKQVNEQDVLYAKRVRENKNISSDLKGLTSRVWRNNAIKN